jgi:hypothetical protein
MLNRSISFTLGTWLQATIQWHEQYLNATNDDREQKVKND